MTISYKDKMEEYSLDEMGKDLNRLGFSYLTGRIIMLMVIIFISSIGFLLSKSGKIEIIESSYFINLMSSLPVLSLLFVLLFYYREEKLLSKYISNNEGIGINYILKTFIISYPIMVSGSIIAGFMVSFLDTFGITFMFEPEEFSAENLRTIATIASTGLMAPILEECIFRGVILNVLRRYGDKFAIITSALLFAFFHGNMFQFFTALTAGLWLGYLFTKTKSLVLVILMHGLSNSLTLVYGIFAIPIIVITIMKVGLFLLAIAIYYYNGRKYTVGKDITILEKKDFSALRDNYIRKKEKRQNKQKESVERISPYKVFFQETAVILLLMLDISYIILITVGSIRFV